MKGETMKPKIPSSIERVHLQWEGPKTWEEKVKLKSAIDYGIYQIYGCHPVHGADCLLYIGKASDHPMDSPRYRRHSAR